MMLDIFLWSLKASIIVGILYLFYRLLFDKNTFFLLKRTVLLSIIVLATVLPLISITLSRPQGFTDQMTSATSAFKKQENYFKTTSTNPIPRDSKSQITSKMSWQDIVIIVYSIGALASFSLLFFELGRILLFQLTGSKRKDLGANIISHRKVKYPFSFMKWVFIPTDENYNHSTWNIIKIHESLHIRQLHSIDTIIAAFFQCFLWYNPLVYLFHKSLKNNHEALADEKVLETIDFKEYTETLIGTSIYKESMTLGHSFALGSSLSKRINTMNNNKTRLPQTAARITIFMAISACVFFGISVHGQEIDLHLVRDIATGDISTSTDGEVAFFTSNKIYEELNVRPDTWAFNINSRRPYPLILLKKHKKLITNYFQSSETEVSAWGKYGYSIVMSPTAEIRKGKYNIQNHMDRYTTELMVMLTKSERLEMYELAKDWIEKYVVPVYPNYEPLDEFEFMENQYMLLQSSHIGFVPSDRDFVSIDDLDKKPIPAGGIERLLKNVASKSRKEHPIKLSDLPEKIVFEVVIGTGGILHSANLISNVDGSDAIQDRAYLFLGKVNRSLIELSQLYGWEPGRRDGKAVATRFKLEIPKGYFKVD